jgi:DNA topoisomerase VI subunit B
MSKHTAKITSKSIAQSGLPSDFRKAIAEYIWNGFDAKANHIHVNFRGNEIGYIHSFEITDNGEGISIETIDQTFGHFLDSTKIGSFDGDNYVRGKKGKGRYSFSTFCNQAVWNTTCQTEKRDYLNYKIVINKSSQVNFNIVDQVPAKVKKTGTTVH